MLESLGSQNTHFRVDLGKLVIRTLFLREVSDAIMVGEPLANPRSSFEQLLIRVFMCLLESLYCKFVIFELSYVY